MFEKNLTLEQNICSARIFLNTFGLYLEDTNNINESSKIKIIDNSMNTVGNLSFNNDKVVMSANYNNVILNAHFGLAKIKGFMDIEEDNALFGKWSSKINFKVQQQNNIKLSGEILVDCSIDSKFEISCHCHPLIKCEIPSKGEAELKILRDGRTFGLNINSQKYNETIDVKPWDNIKHVISKGEYNPEKYQHEYTKYMGIFEAGGSDKDKLHVFLEEKNWDKIISLKNAWPLKEGTDNSKSLTIQKGMLMQDLDPKMFEKIKELGELLSFGAVSLLDNLISVCYDSYTDDEISALLGVNKQKMNYQNGADTLVDSYFGIGKNDTFLSLETQKRLLKK